MSFFGEDFLQGFFQEQWVKDYAHASKLFRTNGYEFLPRYKFLYHVFFNINTAQIPSLQGVFGNGDQAVIGMLVKTVDLPRYQMQVEVMNQYNRKRLVQTKLNYQPVTITFQDDQGDLVRNMWYNYYAYYYKDPSYKYEGKPVTNGTIGNLATLSNGFGYNTRDTYDPSRQNTDWGYIGESYSDGLQNQNGTAGGKPAFFNDIKVYGFSQKKFSVYTLINPMITEWQHDTYDYSQGNGVMQNTMTIQYETVKYASGAIGGLTPSNTVSGFADPAHYDVTRSALARPGSTATVFGQGGLVDAGVGIFEDLEALTAGRGGVQNVLGAVQKAGTAYNTFKDKNIASIARDDINLYAKNVARDALPGAMRLAMNKANGIFFPTPPKSTTPPNVTYTGPNNNSSQS